MDNFDSTYGYTLEQLLKVGFPAGPADFAEFWRATYDEVMSIPLRLEKRKIKSPRKDREIWEVEYDSLHGVRIGGWIIAPADGEFERGVVEGHGYGGRGEPGLDSPGPASVVIQPCARGFHRSAHPDIPDTGGKHVLYGIESRETYSHRGSVADYWQAGSALLQLYPQVAGCLDYAGGSFGGGIGAMLVPWDKRLRRAYLDVPSFGNHPLRVTLPCTGSGESVRLLYKKQPEIMKVLQYFDAATAASYTEIPVYVSAALSDPAVPPPGQFAVYNALKGPKELLVRETGHPNTEADDKAVWEGLEEWFAK